MSTKLQAFAMGLLGAAAGLGLGLWLAPDPPPLSPAGRADDQAAVLAELRSIRELLARPRTELQAPPAGSRTGAGESLPANNAELVAALRDLETALRASRALSVPTEGSSEDTSLPALREDDIRPTDLASVREVRSALSVDEVSPYPELFGLSPAQVYRKFGTPSVVGNSPGRVRWLYEDPPGRLVITFIGGYVAWVQSQGE